MLMVVKLHQRQNQLQPELQPNQRSMQQEQHFVWATQYNCRHLMEVPSYGRMEGMLRIYILQQAEPIQ